MPWLIVLLGYFLGSIPTAYIVAHLARGRDIRQIGDGNAGAANVFRQVGAKAGITVFLVDAGKGALAVLFAQLASLSLAVVLFAGAAAVIGHNWPIFLRFRGGRGESTTIGVLMTVITQPVLILAGPTLAALYFWRNVNKASCILFIPLPLVCWYLQIPGILIAYSVALPCLVGFTHFLRTRYRVAKPA